MDIDTLTCPNCKHEFDFNEHLPKLLECNNTICLNCLKSVKKLRFRSKFKCLFDKKHKHKYPKKKYGFEILPNEQVAILMIKVKEYNKKLDEFENMLNNFDELSRNQMNSIANSKGYVRNLIIYFVFFKKYFSYVTSLNVKFDIHMGALIY